jgi:DNA-directed RNA polymerase sigma subunit (sigma70/sigma32)
MKRFTDNQYRDLVKAYRLGDKSALDKIQEESTWIIKEIASRYKGDRKTLINAGRIGLTKAIEVFDLRKTYKFLTYATWWIRAGVHRELGLPN